MLRGGPRTPTQETIHQQQLLQEQNQQRQKKRLSFRDPEVEGPQRNSNSFFAGCKSKTLARPTSHRPKVTITKRQSSSVEDLTLEDLSLTDGHRSLYLDSEERETDIIDNSPPQDIPSYHRRFHISSEDTEEYLESFVSPIEDMRGPTADSDEAMLSENCIPVETTLQETRSSSSDLHQIQMLRYQHEQQHQQTQMALHQIQLLRDQMSAEGAARKKAQEQNNELMQQNTDLLNHMEKLFQQIEELENQVQQLQQEKRGRRSISSHPSPVPSLRQPMSYTAHRRQSTEQVLQHRLLTTPKSPEQEKKTAPIRSSYTAARRNSLTLNKPQATISKPTPTQNSSQYTPYTARKSTVTSSKTYGAQSKNTDTGNKPKDTLKIGETSPPVINTRSSPFNSLWNSKPKEGNVQISTEKPSSKPQVTSLSSLGKKPQDGTAVKSSLFSSGSSLSVTGPKSKKYSSSTSDLYTSSSAAQSKSTLLIEEPQTPKVRNAVSNLSINSTTSTSKLPRYQPYTGWQRRTSLTNDTESVSGLGKESYKNVSSLFKR